MRRTLAVAATAAAGLLLATGCAGRPGTFHTGPTPAGATGNTAPATTSTPTGAGLTGAASAAHASLTVRLGFLPGPAQASALIGLREGFFATALAPHAGLHAIPYPTPAAEIAALKAGRIDAAYTTPGAILALSQGPHPVPVTVISGASSGGAMLITSPHITSPAQLQGHTITVPEGGSAQDIALRYWLRTRHLTATGPHAVTITPAAPAATLHDFATGAIAGAWEPAPYDTELQNAGGHVLVNEATLWPGGQFAAANLITTTAFLNHHSAAVLALLKGQTRANDYLHHSFLPALTALSAELAALHTPLTPATLTNSLAQLTYTNDPITTTLTVEAQHAATLGLPHPAANSLTALYNLAPLNLVLRTVGEPPINP